MNDDQLLSVIVPTCDRHDTLKWCLETITSQKDQRLEIIVSDNFSSPETKKVVDALNDHRLRYIRTDQRLGMPEHWEFALNHAKGNWITFIGDDDGLMPDAVQTFFTIVSKHPDQKALHSPKITYNWPGFNGINTPMIFVPEILSFQPKTKICPSSYALKQLINGITDYRELPSLYTGGFLHKDIILRAKNVTDQFFLSLNPDIYSGIMACALEKTFLKTDHFLTISGRSSYSTGHTARRTKTIEDTTFFNESNIDFEPELGDGFKSPVPIFTYETYLKISKFFEMPIETSIQDQMVISLIHMNKNNQDDVCNYIKKLCKINNIAFDDIKKRAEQTPNGLKHQPRIRIEFSNAKTIKDACDYIDRLYRSRQILFLIIRHKALILIKKTSKNITALSKKLRNLKTFRKLKRKLAG